MKLALAWFLAHATILFVVGCGTKAPEPEPDTPFVRIATRHFDSLQRDTLIQRLTGAKTGLQVIGSQPVDAFWRLSDSELSLFARLLSESLEKVDTVTCATFAKSRWQNFMTVPNSTDSSLAVRWVEFFDRLVRTGFEGAPRGETASREEVSAAVSEVTASLPPAERARILQALGTSDGSATDRCLFAQRYFRSFADMPPSRAGPVLRTLLGPAPQ